MNLGSFRAWAAPLLTLALGGFTAMAVAVSSFQVLWEAAQAQEDAFVRHVELVADLASRDARGVLSPRPPPAPTPTPQPPARGRAVEPAPPAPDTQEQDQRALERELNELVQRSHVDLLLLLDAESTPVIEAMGASSLPALTEAATEACTSAPPASAGPWISATFAGPGDTPMRAGCSPVLSEDGAPLGMAVAVASARYLLEQEDRESKARSLLLGLGALVGLGVILGVRFILSPVREVAEAAQRMASGERGVRLNTSGEAEIAQVAAALNELASAVEAREDEIRTRLSGIAQLTGMVAHEVRNPLQSLSLLATLARTEQDPGERDSLLTSIETEIHVLEGVVQRFLRSSGPLQISRVPADLVEVVQKALGVAGPQARTRNVVLEVVTPPRLASQMDASLVRRALENLLLNAIEFSGKENAGKDGAGKDSAGQGGGKVRVEVTRRGREAVLYVDDNGPGVPRQERDRVFKAYYSSKAGGTGLGLALVKQVFEAHGGSIRCEDSPLGGARFAAILPIEESMEVPFAT